MLCFQRPKRPKGFSRAVEPVLRAAKRAVAEGLPISDDDAPWRDDRFKRLFAEAQHDKCGYCETFALNHPAPMDHHAPKGAIHVLLREGEETDGVYRVRGRETLEVSSTGYYWLIVSWENWLLGCERCNTRWKGALFPTFEDDGSSLMEALRAAYALGGVDAAKVLLRASSFGSPNPRRPFTPLLLHPFGPEDPVDHLEYNDLGQIAPRNGSIRGRETIRTCGLYRESLQRARRPIAEDTFRLVRRLMGALDAEHWETAQSAARDLLSLGDARRSHAGMVRSIVLSQIGIRWPDLDALANKLDKRAARGKRRRA